MDVVTITLYSPQELNVHFLFFHKQAELEAMKALVASLQANQNGAVANTGGGNNAESERMIAELQAKLAEKQSDLAHSLGTCCTCSFVCL